MKAKVVWFAVLAVTTVVVTGANAWIAHNRYAGFIQRPVDYADLYHLEDMPAITAAGLSADGLLTLRLSAYPAREWTIVPDQGDPYVSSGALPQIRLREGVHRYSLRAEGPGLHRPVLRLEVDYADGGYQIRSLDAPMGEPSAYTIADYINEESSFPPDDIRQARAQIVSQIGVLPTDGTPVKIEKLVDFLLDRLDDKRGTPTGRMYQLSPYQQYQAALRGESPIWCSNYQRIYNFYANLLGIPSRIVSVSSGLDVKGKDSRAHTFNESYIAETNAWAFVDLTSRKAFVVDREGRFQNTIDLFDANRLMIFDGLQARVYGDGELRWLPYVQVNASEAKYFAADARFAFDLPNHDWDDLWSKVHGYFFLPQHGYALDQRGWKYYLKQTLLLVQVTLGVVWLGLAAALLLRVRGRRIRAAAIGREHSAA